MTRRDEAEQAMRCAVCADDLDDLATVKCTRCGAALEQRAATLAHNAALEEAAGLAYEEMVAHPWWAYPFFRLLSDKVTKRIRALKKES